MRLQITRVEPAFGGASFGDVGPYEKIVGRVSGTADPAHPLNRVIVGLDRAPVNAEGHVDYACDFYLLKPVDLRRGNRALFYDVVNRGGKVALHAINDALRNPDGGMRIACNDPAAIVDAGNGFLMRQGFSILWSGWQSGGVPPGDGRMSARLPIATAQGAPIVGLSRDEFVFEHRIDPAVAQLSYPAAALDQGLCTLTVRQRERDPRTPIGADGWRFLSDTEIEIVRPAPFDASAIYEFIYPARDPVVMGLGFAAVRDLVTFLRSGAADLDGTVNPLALDGEPAIERTVAFGMSQSGRFLRDFLHLGFNEGLDGDRVFDGMMACMTGSRKSFTNAAFAQPNRFSRQHEDRLFPGDQFPFTYATTTDPVSGRTDGILARCEASGTCPKIMQIESASDFFQGRSSLLATDGRGAEVAVPETVRLYHLAGVQHGGGGDPTLDYARMFPSSRYAPNLADPSPIYRALIVAMDEWVRDGTTPPSSRFPCVRDGTLVDPAPERYGFPAIPGVSYPGIVNELGELDYERQPPEPLPDRGYRVLVPAVDVDGNEVAGIRMPCIAVPLGTHTGWTMRNHGYAAGELGAIGAFFPFATTLEARRRSDDPRPSISERYRNLDDYVRKVAEAVRDLGDRRLLLEEDAERIEEAAKAQTDIPDEATRPVRSG